MQRKWLGTVLAVASLFLSTTIRADDAALVVKITEIGGQVTKTDGTVTKLFFKDCSKLGDAEFRLIGRLHGLKSLTLYGQCNGLNDQTLDHLLTLKNLEELGTDRIQITDAALAKFATFTNLRSLSFFHTSFGMKNFDGSGFAALKALPKLEKLTIAGSPFNDRGMAAIAEITQLRDFRTWHTFQSSSGNDSLTKLPNLRSLWFGQRLRRYDGSSNAASLDDAACGTLAKLSGLESLILDEARLTYAGLSQLKSLTKLKKLELRRIDIPAADVEKLKAELPNVAIDFKPLTDDEREKLNAFLKTK